LQSPALVRFDAGVSKESRFRAAEARLWQALGLEPAELQLQLPRTGAKVRALVVGSGPPVAFVHGGSNAASSWADLAARLTTRTCVLVDRPGCGLSPRAPEPLRDVQQFERFTDDFLSDVIDAIDAPEADVIATSFGGYFGLRGAAAAGERVRRLVLLGYSIGAPIDRVPPVMRMSVLPGLGQLMVRLPPPRAAIKPMLRQIGLKDAVESGAFTEIMVDWFRSLLCETDTMLNELRDAPPFLNFRRGLNDAILFTDDVLKAVTVPTLMLWGRSDPMGGEPVAKALAARLPNATLEMVDGGHAVWIDHPDSIAARITAFLT
jgi:pimeloyl-ACP methyl ester carboxylesterase